MLTGYCMGSITYLLCYSVKLRSVMLGCTQSIEELLVYWSGRWYSVGDILWLPRILSLNCQKVSHGSALHYWVSVWPCRKGSISSFCHFYVAGLAGSF